MPTESAVKPGGLLIGVLVGACDVLIWKHFVGPSVSDIKELPPVDSHIESSERSALLVCTGFTIAVAALAKSPEVFTIGGVVIVALDFATKHANATAPTSSGNIPNQTPVVDPYTAYSYPEPEYGS